MSSLIHADVFFFITAIAVVLVTLGVLVVLYFIAGIARDLKAITAKLRHASDELEGDFELVRGELRSGALRATSLFGSFIDFLRWRLERRKKARVVEGELEDE